MSGTGGAGGHGAGGSASGRGAGSGAGGQPRWSGTPDRAAQYAARFAALAAGGSDVHGEADFCAQLLDPGARVLDAGCGTGRVAIRLAELGWHCTGVDNDPHMLAQARAASMLTGCATTPTEAAATAATAATTATAAAATTASNAAPVRWVLGDLATSDLGGVGGPFDLVVAAGNVIPLVAPGTEAVVVANLARALSTMTPSARLVAGFGLDAAHLPLPAAPFGLAEYDAWCAAAGLTLVHRFAGWGGSVYDGGGYAVSVHAPAT